MAITKGVVKVKADRKTPKTRKEEDQNTRDEVDKGKSRQCDSVAKRSTGGDESDICADCSKAVVSSQQGMKCDGCGHWHHVQCEKVAEDVHGFLSSHNEEPSLLWYCRKCATT